MKSAAVPRLARNILGPRAFALEVCVRFVAQRFERRRQPHRRQRVELDLGFADKARARSASHPSTATSASCRFGNSLAPVSTSLPFRDIGLAPARVAATLRWIRPCSSAANTPPAFSISWNSDHAASQSCLRQRLDAAGAGGGIGHLGEVGFFQQHQLRVARDASRERIGQSQRQRMRQHGDGIGAAKAGGEGRHGRAQHVHVGVALVSMRQAVSAATKTGFGASRRPARPAPTAAAARGISRCQELIGIGGEPE